MSALVYQSHSNRAPRWIRQCTATVRAWAAARGYRYRLLGDELFDGVGLEVALKARSMLPVADLGRLLWAERLLAENESVVWVDADVVVFDPERLAVDTNAPFLVCREVLVTRDKAGLSTPGVTIAYSPTVLFFRRGEPFLGRWIAAARKLADQRPQLGDAEFGRELLRKLARGKVLPAIKSVGHFNAAVLKEIYGHEGPATQLMMRASGTPFAAANLCGHYHMHGAVYLKIVEKLIATRGRVVNDALPSLTAPS
jgi:hypothetical protein